MRLNFKKVSAIAASALMVGMTMGTAVAAYPTPFVGSAASSVAIVYGTQAGFADGSPLDLAQASNINSDLSGRAGTTGGSTSVTGGQYWQVGTGNDALEINETMRQVASYIGVSDFGLLGDGKISNEKGEASYKQYLYFEPSPDADSVVYTSDPDTDALGLYLKFNNGETIARYVMDFTSNLKSDIDTADNKLSDIEDKSITVLGKTYTITSAYRNAAGVALTLMSGASSGTVSEGTPITVGGYTVSVVVSSSTAAQFTVTSASGTETTSKMAKGDIEKLSDGNYLAITDITYEGYAEGDQSATFYIGADKIELNNNSAMIVNGETISAANVAITSTNDTDVSISQIAVNMTAEDDLYVPVNGKLSTNANLDEPQVLLSQNWDIEFKGLQSTEYETIKLDATGSDKKYVLEFQNYEGNVVKLPLIWVNATGTFGGDTADDALVLNGKYLNVSKNDYFILNSADPKDPTSNARTLVVQYRGSDKTTDTNPQAHFVLNPGANEEKKDVPLSAAGSCTLQAAQGTFTFVNGSSCEVANLCDLSVSSGDYGNSGGTANLASNYIRTYYNTFINITDTNVSTEPVSEGQFGAPWRINVTVDDTSRDGDTVALPNIGAVFYATLKNTTTDVSTTLSATGKWLSDPDNSDVTRYIGMYGQEITSTDPADSPASIVATVPKGIVTPLVYVSTGDLTVTSTSGAAGSLGYILYKDSEVSSIGSKNLIVVGGSCVNSVAAKLVGAAACGADFTTKTGIGSGQFLIQSYANPYSTGKVALLVAGYDAVDTKNAATYLITKAVDTTVGKKYKGTSATTAELVVV